MLILGIIIGILIMILGIIFLDDYEFCSFTCAIGLFIVIGSLIGMFCCFNDLGQAKIIDEKISMYQEENAKIENEMTTIVNNYKNYEKEVIENIADMEVLLIKFPELQTSELVKTQMNVYMTNNNKIKELKENKLDYRLAKWWLYFGK